MEGYFDATEAFVSFGLISLVLCWGLALVVLTRVPGLITRIYEVYSSYRQQGLDLYISRFIPYRLFHALALAVGALILSVVFLMLAVDYGLVSDRLDIEVYVTIVGAGVVVQGVMWLWRTLSFGLWRYVFMSKDDADLLAQDYILLQLMQLWSLLPLLFVAFSSALVSLKLWSVVVLVGIVQLCRMVQVCRRLWHSAEDGIYLFLYLCTHEIVPLVYTFALLRWSLGILQGYVAST